MPYCDQDKSKACKPEELVKITNGFFENGDFCFGGKFKLVKNFELCIIAFLGEIRTRMDQFRQVLSRVTNSIVNVDQYVVHEDDKTKTDVLLHFVNPGDNTIMEVRN